MSTPARLFALGLLLSGALASRALAEEAPRIPPVAIVGPQTEPVPRDKYAKILHVSAASAVPADGSREHPFATPASALGSIRDANSSRRYAVLVAAGVYKVVDLPMRPYVDLFGGFGPAWERDVVQNPTVLDAGKAGRVVRGCDHATLDGFVVTGGRCREPGGAILCDGASPTISNNAIYGNETLPPAGFRFDMIHQRGSDGGALALVSGSAAVVRNNLIYENATGVGNGAGIWVWNQGKPTIAHNVILNNRAGVAGRPGKEGARSSNGGGIAVSLDCQPEIIGNVIAENQVADNSDGGGIYLEYDANAHVAGNLVVANTAMDDGGGIYLMKNSEPVLEQNLIAANRTTSDGSSGVRLSKEGRLRASHNLFIGNRGALDAVNSWMVLTYNTFVDSTKTALVYENKLEHLAPSRAEGNLFAGKMQTVALVKNPSPGGLTFRGNAAAGGLPGEDNLDLAPAFLEDGARGQARAGAFDVRTQTTRLEVTGLPAAGSDLAGRLVRLGEQWKVVRSSDAASITVWGRVEPAAASFELVPTYQPVEKTPARGLGAYAIEKKTAQKPGQHVRNAKTP